MLPQVEEEGEIRNMNNKRKKKEREDETLLDFAENSTTHGLAYVFERNVHYWSRLVWLLTVIALFVLAIVMIMSLFNSWKASPITTTIDDPAVPIEEIKFPAITLCGMGTVNDLVDLAYSKQLRDLLISKGIDVSAYDERSTESSTYSRDFGFQYQEELYGILEGREPSYLAELMMTLSPNEYLKSNILSGESPLCSKAAIDKCSKPATYDESSDLCYSDGRKVQTVWEAHDTCIKQLSESFSPQKNENLESLADLIKQGMKNIVLINICRNLLNYKRVLKYSRTYFF